MYYPEFEYPIRACEKHYPLVWYILKLYSFEESYLICLNFLMQPPFLIISACGLLVAKGYVHKVDLG